MPSPFTGEGSLNELMGSFLPDILYNVQKDSHLLIKKSKNYRIVNRCGFLLTEPDIISIIIDKTWREF